jgi:hypothetical protein
MKIDKKTSIYRYISEFNDLTSAFKIIDISFIALSSLVILRTLNVLNILIDLKADSAPPPDDMAISTTDSNTIEPSI